jgi:hypothetical protein
VGEWRDPLSAVRRYPLISFFVLAYVFSWWPWIVYILGLAPGTIIGFGPFLAALVVLAITGGRSWLRRRLGGAPTSRCSVQAHILDDPQGGRGWLENTSPLEMLVEELTLAP